MPFPISLHFIVYFCDFKFYAVMIIYLVIMGNLLINIIWSNFYIPNWVPNTKTITGTSAVFIFNSYLFYVSQSMLFSLNWKIFERKNGRLAK